MALRDAGMVKRMLVVATLRICQLTWRQEAAQWTQFKDLKFSFLHGYNKLQMLKDGLATDADVFLINYEGLDWLTSQFPGRQLPFDIVVADEVTKLKNYKSVRSKKFRPATLKTRYKWALTGTPSPNGYMDLFGQWLWLDTGRALGKYITHFRDMFFKQDYNGFKWVLQDRGGERIEARIAPYVYRLPYTVKSGLVPNPIYVEMSKEARAVYRDVKNNFLAELPEGKITAGNQAAAYSKLSQMANGAVYINGGADVLVLHDDKLDALDELLDELQGKQLLIAYEFQHDLTRIQERMVKRFGEPAPFLGAGVSGKRAEEIQTAWNNGLIPVLLAHPQSAGHGLNLQKGGAHHICWFSATWDLELWEQFIRRIWRQGNKAETITNHILIVRGTIDELKLAALDGKGKDQAQLMQAMVSLIVETPTGGDQPEQMENQMSAFTRGRLPDGPTDTAQAQPAAGITPKGWGQRATTSAPENAVDKEEVANRISQQPPPQTQAISQGDEARDAVQRAQDEAPAVSPVKAFAGFSNAVKSAVGADPGTATPLVQDDPNRFAPSEETTKTVETPKRTRTTKAVSDKVEGPSNAVEQNASNASSGQGVAAFSGYEPQLTINISGTASEVRRLLALLGAA